MLRRAAVARIAVTTSRTRRGRVGTEQTDGILGIYALDQYFGRSLRSGPEPQDMNGEYASDG